MKVLILYLLYNYYLSSRLYKFWAVEQDRNSKRIVSTFSASLEFKCDLKYVPPEFKN